MNDGGEAFPGLKFDYNEHRDQPGKSWPYDPETSDGMSVRVYFAAKAMAAMIAATPFENDWPDEDAVAEHAAKFADALIKELGL